MLKCTSFFTLGKGGWSETLFLPGAVTNPGMTALKALQPYRLALAPSTVTVIGRRVSVIENPAVVQTEQDSAQGTYADGRDYLNASVYFPAVGGLNIKRNIFLRGIPDSQVVGGVYTPSGLFPVRTSNWAISLAAQGFSIRTQDKTTYALQTVFSIDATGAMVMNVDPGWQKGDQIKFFRAVDTLGKPVKKIYTISNRVDATHFQLLNWEPGRLLVNKLARKYVLFLSPITFIGTGVATTRKTGRPFGLPVGRRRVAK